jgi:hypothetical protein
MRFKNEGLNGMPSLPIVGMSVVNFIVYRRLKDFDGNKC